MFISDFINIYGKEQGMQKYEKYLQFFSVSRFKYNYNIHSVWLQSNNYDLREATPIPFISEKELKKEYYWSELIH